MCKYNNQNKRVKILFLLHLPPPVHGSSVIGKTIYSNKLINNTYDCHYINLLASNNISETGKFNIRKIVNLFVILCYLLKNIIVCRPRFCYFALTTTGFAFYRDVIFVVVLKVFNIKHVFHLHNKGIKNNSNFIFKRYLYKSILYNASVIILSELLYFDIEGFVKKSNVYICQNAIMQVDINDQRKKNSIPIILFLSNLILSKGILVLLDSLKILKDSDYIFSCIFVGSEGDLDKKQFNEEIKKRELQKIVTYEGMKVGDEKKNCFIKSDIFVLPTTSDCFPLVLLEAMNYGLPVISTFEGAIPEIVDDGITGLLCKKNNNSDLAEKLKILIEKTDMRKKMGDAGRIKFLNCFTIESFEKKLVTNFELILKNT